MIKVWFLMALISYPNIPAISYKGYGGFYEKEKCEDRRILAEETIANMEINRGTQAFFIETYCMEMFAFPTQFDKPKLNKGTKFGA